MFEKESANEQVTILLRQFKSAWMWWLTGVITDERHDELIRLIDQDAVNQGVFTEYNYHIVTMATKIIRKVTAATAQRGDLLKATRSRRHLQRAGK